MDLIGSAFDVPITTGGNTCSKLVHDLGGPPEPEEMTSLFASEMNKLTFKEREVVYEDLHAVSKPAEESVVNMGGIVDQVKEEISSIRLKAAYKKALFLNREYVDNPNFILMFLRAAKFNAKDAAQKIIDHFKYKLELFGPDFVGREILFEDLDEATKDALASGAVQIPPGRDIAGRALIFFAFDRLRYSTVKSQIRVVWYLMMCTLAEKTTQQNGIVLISYNINYSSNNLHIDLLLKSSMIAKAMPQKIMGIHFCYNSEFLHPLSSTLQLIVGSSGRLRFRSHYGSLLEVLYSLANFGIQGKELPIDDAGNVSTDMIEDYIRIRIAEDYKYKQKYTDKIIHPLSSDVVLGRGWHQQEHPGNLRLAKIVDDHREAYKNARKLHKTNLNWRIVELMKESGGRFLERSQKPEEGWVEAGNESARDKVSKCFRTATKRNSKGKYDPQKEQEKSKEAEGTRCGEKHAKDDRAPESIPSPCSNQYVIQNKKARVD